MPEKLSEQQHTVCVRFGAEFCEADPSQKVGIALQTRGVQPLNALRQLPEGDTCGWYIWWGDTLNEDPKFFQPLHVSHLPDYCPTLAPYLALPPGWRVQLAPGHEDVWFDEDLRRLDPSGSRVFAHPSRQPNERMKLTKPAVSSDCAGFAAYPRCSADIRERDEAPHRAVGRDDYRG